MTSAVDDIDRFIADQKSKLAQERQQLNGGLPPQASSRAGGHPTRSKEPHFSTKGGALSPRPVPRGSYDRVRNQLNEERRKEYNHLLQEKGHKMDVEYAVDYNRFQNERKLGGGGKMDEGASLPIKDRHSAKTRAMIQRNQEYNDFIRQKEERERRQKALRFGGSRVMSEPDVSPKATQSSQPYYDNRGPPPARGGDMTFGERPLPPRQGWRTPVDNYDELLRRKREEEARYRRHQEEPYYGRSSSMRPAFSDSHLARSYDEDEKLTSRKMDHLDQEYDTRKVRFRDEAIRQGAISSSDVPDRARYDNRAPYNWGESSSGRRRSLEEADSRPPYRGAPTRGGARSAPIDDDGLGLKLGERDSQSAAQRKKEAYRRDLEQQIAEAREAKRREKQRERNAELSVNASGERDPEKFADRLKNLPPQESKPRFDPINHAAVQEKPNYARAQPRTSSLLEQPLDLGSYPTSQLNPNDPYVYYGLRDPLDPETAKRGPPIGMAYGQQGVIPGTVPMVPAGSGIVGGVPGGLSGGLPGGILNPRGPELTRQDTAILRGESAIINYVGDEQLSPRHQQDPKSYQQELLEQMRERELKRKKEKEEEDRYNRKLEAEARSYDPWGKGGGGAPMKDVKGNIVADLRQLHNINEGVSGSGTGQLYSDVPLPNVSPRPSAFADASKPTFARGNVWNLENEDPNKIAQGKTAQDSYKDYLQQQVDEKRRRDAEEKEKIRLEEEREEKRLQAEREKMQKEFEEEQERQRRKEEEARLRNEQLILAAEDKRKEIERQRREEENRRLEEMRRNEDEERQKKYAENAARVASPPIPTLRNKAEEFDEIPVHVDKNGRLTNSPPIPSSRSRVGDNKDVIHALSAMRRQLHSEQKRIQQQLENREYDAYDPVPGARYRKRTPQVDVFEMARNKEAVYPRRTSTEPANTNTVAEFTELKHRNGKSRQEFRSLYPEHPNSNSTLETQQNALIQQQEEKLNAIRRGRITTAQDMPSMRPLDLGLGRESPSMPLPSESAFVNANTGETEIPSPLGYKPSSARQRRRARDIPSPSLKQADPLGSVTSFDVDALASKNKERLRKLKQLEDGDSLADPDEVLKRFMAKTSHDRPVSATSQDAWLRPSATDAY